MFSRSVLISVFSPQSVLGCSLGLDVGFGRGGVVHTAGSITGVITGRPSPSVMEAEIRTQTHAEGRTREDTDRRRRPRVQEGGLGRTQPCPRRGPRLPASRTGGNKSVLFKPPSCSALLWELDQTNTTASPQNPPRSSSLVLSPCDLTGIGIFMEANN